MKSLHVIKPKPSLYSDLFGQLRRKDIETTLFVLSHIPFFIVVLGVAPLWAPIYLTAKALERWDSK